MSKLEAAPYESYYGLRGKPFLLDPDPGFFYPSKAHQRALAYLKYGVVQGQGFIVITGEVGAGKTLIARTLVTQIDSTQVVAAQLASPQLGAAEFLRAVAASFGLETRQDAKARLVSEIEAFLLALTVSHRRALLIVDEAHNLSLDALEELRLLANLPIGALQTFLIGRPQLRSLMRAADLEPLRQRVIASCHLGPFDRKESQSYIEHRLRRVGWSGRPELMPDALDLIHSYAGGIPRELNELCNRAITLGGLGKKPRLDAAEVEEAIRQARKEGGDSRIPDPRAGIAAAGARAANDAHTIVWPLDPVPGPTTPAAPVARRPAAPAAALDEKFWLDLHGALGATVADLEKCLERFRGSLSDIDVRLRAQGRERAAPGRLPEE